MIPYKPNKSQQAFHKASERNITNGGGIVFFLSGLGGGKTYAGAWQTIFNVFKYYPNKSGGIISPTYKLAQDTVVATLRDLFDAILGGNYQFNKVEMRFYLPGGGEIAVLSGDRPERIIGSNWAWVWLDEPASMKEEVYNRVLVRLRGASAPWLYLTGTPEGYGWVYERIYNGDSVIVRGTSYDNKYLPQQFFSMLEKLPEKMREAYLLGEFVDFNAVAAYWEFDRKKHTIPQMPFDSDLPVYLCVDFNVNPMGWVLVQERDGKWYVPDNGTIFLRNSNTWEACREVRRRLERWGYTGTVYVYGDPAGKARHTSATRTDYDIIRQELPQAKIEVRSQAPLVRERVLAVNSFLREGKLVISLRGNDQLIADFERTRLKSSETLELDKSDPDRTHLTDALGYGIIEVHPIFNRRITVRRW